MKSPTVRNDNSWVAVARTNWNRNEAQSCPAFQIRTGENNASAISAAAQGYGLASQRRRQSGTSMKAATAGSSITAVNFDSSASPAKTPAASHQRAIAALGQPDQRPDHRDRKRDRRTSGETLAINSP